MDIRDKGGKFIKGTHNLFKGKTLPWNDKAIEARKKSGMYNDLSHLKKHNFRKGHTPWNKGLKGVMPKPWNKGTRGVMPIPHNKGQGVGTPLGYSIRKNIKYTEWRTSVFTRDKYTCVWCRVVGKRLHADHIKPFALICRENNITNLEDALNCQELWDIKNGRTLCYACHRKTDTYSGKYQTELYKFPRKIGKLKTK